MLLPRVPSSLRPVGSTAFKTAQSRCTACSANISPRANASRPHSSPILTFVRNATHAAEGRANGPKQGAGKRLGAKKTGEQYVIPGNIIFRQRGTKWHPGENVGMGRDHTLHATQPGFVKYYRDPELHPKRRYIGVVLRRTDVLPRPPNASRRRRLGMIAVPRTDIEPSTTDKVAGNTVGVLAAAAEGQPGHSPSFAPPTGAASASSLASSSFPSSSSTTDPSTFAHTRKYASREANWWIGRAADRARESGSPQEKQRVTPHKYERKNRFAALRVRKRKAEKRALMRATMGARGPKGGKKGKR
ncbi:MAG: 54S ribosomal protein L2 mitochondrial [Bathelium mastoideum]|nr:MAG: 54S ribosomal protein L2 mitochondrial [Bathelium mastoideum]